MANSDFYDTLWISKWATEADVKKAYRKQAMQWHPDKHKWDKKAEAQFKKINEAYEILKDPKKRKQYDTFWKAWSQFSGNSGWQAWFGGFEDLFKNAQSSRNTSYSSFDFWDLFWDTRENFYEQKREAPKKEAVIVDVEKTYEVPIMDLILGTKLGIDTVYNEHLKLKIPEWTKPWTKFKIKWKWRKIWTKTGDMYVIAEAKMPKEIPDDIKKLLESIKYRL
ncbi:MAG: hypothetical protein ACD_49C00021G0018 [uncultured bacterium (gcode 4)]|uniref:J domain-containing protein n=1 Tax=uncultured bacterium (gcode 4) TaxID=1234023 RepID=K2BD80_9BACT|nr:MAG: hypothetical protein ACD_49C00021G0018 [uncultured bacterium (gcode 4)]